MLSFFLVIFLSGYFISNIYEKWSASPVIIALNAVSTSVNDIPFPAVTICNMNQARQSVVQDFREGTVEDALLQSLCAKKVTFNGIRSNNTSWNVFQQFLVRVTATYIYFALNLNQICYSDCNIYFHISPQVSQPCSEMLVRCSFASVDHDCMELFNTVLTDEGLCCIFNRVHPKFLLKKFA